MPNFCGYPDGPCEINDRGHACHPGTKWKEDNKTMTPAQNRVAAPPPPPREKRMKLSSRTSGSIPDPHRILIYGVGGVGKSTFVADMPSPMFIDTQEGTTRLNVERFPKPDNWGDILDAIDELTFESHSIKTLAFDLLDDIESLIWSHICTRDKEDNIIGYGYGKGFDIALVEWRLLISKLERLRREKGMAVAFVGHAQVKTYKSPLTEDYDRYSPQINDKASGLLRGWCDTVLFAQHEVVLKVDPKKKRTRGISTGARLIQTVETAGYYAKNRDNLPDTLPLDYAAFAQAVEAGQPADPAAIRAEIAELAAHVDAETRAKVEHNVKAAGEDATRLVRVLNRLREIQPQQAQGEAQ